MKNAQLTVSPVVTMELPPFVAHVSMDTILTKIKPVLNVLDPMLLDVQEKKEKLFFNVVLIPMETSPISHTLTNTI